MPKLNRQWTVYLVQHTHTDIGYTAPQHQMIPAHLQFIDHALECCDQTDDYPDDAKCRWTCEASWSVREYLRRRPARQIDRLRRRVEEGRIEITALAFNMSEITPEVGLAASLQPLREIIDVLGPHVITAMQNDVNGIGWAMPDYLVPMGVRYLTMGVHQYRSVIPFKRPTPFWWESPAGTRMLAFRPDHYLTGNWLGLNHVADIGAWVGTEQKEGVNLDDAIHEYLAGLEEKEYPYDRVAVQYSGNETDNSPPSTAQCDIVRTWNETHENSQLRIATAREYLQFIEDNHAEQVPVHRLSWPDWWTDGFGSAARETGASRNSHAAVQVTGAASSAAMLLGEDIPKASGERLLNGHEAILLYDEHTFGSVDSVCDSQSAATVVQWYEKSAYAWQGVKDIALSQDEALSYLAGKLPRTDDAVISVFNALNWDRSGFLRVFANFDHISKDGDFHIVDAETGTAVPHVIMNDRPVDRPGDRTLAYDHPAGEYLGLWVENVPALGYRTLRIVPGKANGASEEVQAAGEGPVVLENSFYRVEIDTQAGAVCSLVDAETGRELVDGEGEWKLGQFVYEDFPIIEGERHDTNRIFKPGTFRRSSLRNVHVEKVENTPLWKSVTFSGDADGCLEPNGLRVEVRLYHAEKRVELVYSCRKLDVITPEAIYVVFPFMQGDLSYEVQGGSVRPGTDQIPGTAADWQTMQSYLTVKDGADYVVMSSPDVPLMQLGEINLGKWQQLPEFERPHVYSWVMNNYWWTNFHASQSGEWSWRYSLSSGRDAGKADLTRFGWESSVPLAAAVQSPGDGNGLPPVASLLKVGPENVGLVSAYPSRYGEGIILHVRELEGRETTCEITLPQTGASCTVENVTVIEDPISGDGTAKLAPWESRFFRVTW